MLIAKVAPAVTPKTNAPIVLKIAFNSSNTAVLRWVLERGYTPSGPWTQFATGSINPYSWVTNVDYPTNQQAYYRAAFIWK